MTLDLSAIAALDPIATLPVGGTLGFLANGDLMVLERRWETLLGQQTSTPDKRVLAHQFAAGAWTKVAEQAIKMPLGSPLGCAASPDGAAVAAGYKTVTLVAWPSGKVMASLKGVKYPLERDSVCFSPSGARLAVADGGYVTPVDRWLRVYDARDGMDLAKILTDEFSVWQTLMPDDDTVLVWGLRHDYDYNSTREPQRVLACYDVPTGEVRWRRRYWSQGHRMALDVHAGRLWTSGEHVIELEDRLSGVERSLESLSLEDGTTLRTIALNDLAYPGGVLTCAGAHLVTGWRDRRTSDLDVFAVDVESGAATLLRGATTRYAAADGPRGLCALSTEQKETVIFALPR